MRFVTTGAAGGSGLSAAEVFSAGQFVAGVVDDFVGTYPGRRVGTEVGNLSGKNDDDEQQECLQQHCGDHPPIWGDAIGSFAGQARTGAGKGGADGGDEALPARGPLNEQPGLVVQVDRVFELECSGHRKFVIRGLKPTFRFSAGSGTAGSRAFSGHG
jgi:hypothetical protein